MNKLQDSCTLWQVPVTFTDIGITSLDTKLFSVWVHKKQNKIHYIILLFIIATVIPSWRKKYNTKQEFENKIVKPVDLTGVVVLVWYYVGYIILAID